MTLSSTVMIRLPGWAYDQLKASADKKGIALATELRIRLCEPLRKN